ncbi:hypothetical protein BDV19DRAFT_364572 [Aspergillus venezuelensis]
MALVVEPYRYTFLPLISQRMMIYNLYCDWCHAIQQLHCTSILQDIAIALQHYAV